MNKVFRASLIAISIIWLLAVWINRSPIQQDLTNRSLSALIESGNDWASIETKGRDVTVSGEAVGSKEGLSVINLVENVNGVRIVFNKTTTLPPLKERAETALLEKGYHWVSVSGEDEHLILDGESPDVSSIDQVVKTVKSLRGLNRLSNNLLQPLSVRVREILDANQFNWVRAIVQNRDVTLAGDAISAEENVAARQAVSTLSGLDNLTSEITLLGSLDEEVKRFLDELGTHWASVDIKQRDITISGSTISSEERDQIVEGLGRIPRIGSVTDRIKILQELNPQDCQTQLSDLLTKEKVLFKLGSTDIDGESQALLDSLAAGSRQCPDTYVVISGHTDNIGSFSDNIKLSQVRAQAVADKLNTLGVKAGRLVVTGYGSSQPIASNDSEDGREKNRRIEFKIKPLPNTGE